jgi:hypothetical protein
MSTIIEKMQGIRAANAHLSNTALLEQVPEITKLWQDFFSAWAEAHPEDEIRTKEAAPNHLAKDITGNLKIFPLKKAQHCAYSMQISSVTPLIVVCYSGSTKIETLYSALDVEAWLLRQYALMLLRKQSAGEYFSDKP